MIAWCAATATPCVAMTTGRGAGRHEDPADGWYQECKFIGSQIESGPKFLPLARRKSAMPEVYRKLQIHFSAAEIKAILSERARTLILTRKDVKRIELEQVEHVEGEAVVTLLIADKEIK